MNPRVAPQSPSKNEPCGPESGALDAPASSASDASGERPLPASSPSHSLRPNASHLTNDAGTRTGVHGVNDLPSAGSILDGKYRIDRVIGQGGMAVVLGAMHLHLDERVAIKLMLPEWAADPELVERFMHEGRAASKIRSEHVVRVHDVGLVLDRPYLVMEYLDGSDLDQLLNSVGQLPVKTAVDYLLQACEAIAEAHAVGIIHRDLKPANLFLSHRADGSACIKVLDFGISKRLIRTSRDGARETLPSMIIGSPYYMSPEQMQGSCSVDERSDIWALGAILHELLAGSPPFKGATVTALCATILGDAPPPLTALRPDIPGAIETVVLRCLEKDPKRRFANVAALAVALAPLGTDAAQASAVRIGRVLRAQADAHAMVAATSPHMTPASQPPSHRPTPNAVELLERSLATPKRSGARAFGYIVFTLALTAVGSWIGWTIVSRVDAFQMADETVPPANAIGSPVSVAPPPPVEPLPIASASPGMTMLTSATTPTTTPEVAVDAGALSINTIADASPPKAATNAQYTHHPQAAQRPRPSDARIDTAPKGVPSVRVDDEPFVAPAKPLAPPPTAPSSEGDGLFDDRK